MKNCRNPRPAMHGLFASAAIVVALSAFAGPVAAQVAGSPAVPAAVPFGMNPAPVEMPAETKEGVSLPPAGEPMELDRAKMDESYKQKMGKVDDRLAGLTISSDSLKNADPSPYRGDLGEMAAIQREIRLLELKQKQADLAVKLWTTVYESEETEDHAPSTPLQTPGIPGVTMLPSGATAQGIQPVAPAAPEQKDPLPVVVSILGSGDAVRATVLVPFAGEFTVTNGTVLPNGMKVVGVTAEAVTVSDKGRRIPLSFGNEVPRAPLPPKPDGIPGMASF